jgi:hypothetical protein
MLRGLLIIRFRVQLRAIFFMVFSGLWCLNYSALMGQERYVPYSTGEAAAVPETDLNCSLMEYAADE